jgi:hypothetical protein
MNTTNTKKSGTKRGGLAAALLLSSGLSLIGFGLGAGTAQAAPPPAPQHYCWDFDSYYCYFWDFDWHHDHHEHHDHH